MLQSHAGLKNPFAVQDRPVDFHVAKYEVQWYGVNPTSQLASKKLPFVEFGCSIKEEYPQLSEKFFKVSVPSPTTYPSEAGVFSST